MSADAAVAIETPPQAETRTETWWIDATVPMLAAAIAFAWILYFNLQRMYSLTTGATDLAHYQHIAWAITHGDWHHLELILFPISAIELLWPSPILLAILSAAALAATGPTAYLFFRSLLPADRKESVWLAIALAAPIPLWAATQQAATDLFHPDNLALPFTLVAAWAAVSGRRALMWSFAILTLACGENQAYTMLVLAFLIRGHAAPDIKKHWRLAFYVAIFWFLIGALLVHPYFNPTLPAVVATAGIAASMFGLPLLAPRWLPLAIPPFLATAFDPHYVLLLMFPLMVAGGIGARRLMPSMRPALAVVIALPALVIGLGAGQLPPGLLAVNSDYNQPNAVAPLLTAAVVIPKDAPVSADASLDAWIANRPTINDFPNQLDPSDYVFIDIRAHNASSDQRQAALESLPTSGRRLLYDDGRFQVWSPIGDY